MLLSDEPTKRAIRSPRNGRNPLIIITVTSLPGAADETKHQILTLKISVPLFGHFAKREPPTEGCFALASKRAPHRPSARLRP